MSLKQVKKADTHLSGHLYLSLPFQTQQARPKSLHTKPVNMLPLTWTHLVRNVSLFDIATAMVCLFLSSAVVQRLTSNGGPMIWPVFGIIPTFVQHMNNIYDWATENLRRAGGTFSFRGMWFGNYFGIITVNPVNIEYILKTHFTNFPKGRYYRERFIDLLGDGIFNADNDTWLEQRRAANAEMHSSRFADYSADTIRELVHKRLLILLNGLATTGSTIDLQEVFLRFTFDNICMAAFDVDTGCLAVDLPEVPFARAFEQATELTLLRFIMPPFVWKSMKHLNIGSEKQLKLAIRDVHQFAQKTVSDRRSELQKLNSHPSQRSDLLTRLMEKEPGRFSDTFLKDLCIGFILAGRDTSSVALTWFFWQLQQHPVVEERIVDEILRILKRRASSDGGEVVFEVEELNQMDYLQAALSESLRLYPSVPMDFKEVLEDDVLPDGTLMKKGARVIYSIYSMARMESIWGKDCREFIPERWLKNGVFVNESQYKYVVFNGGPRLCVGKKFAYIQMKMVAASMLLRYRVVVVKGQEVMPKITTTLYMKNGLLVNIIPRRAWVVAKP